MDTWDIAMNGTDKFTAIMELITNKQIKKVWKWYVLGRELKYVNMMEWLCN